MDPKKLDKLFERIEQQKKNGCKVLECKTIDENIKLRLENIKLKKICKKLAEEVINNHKTIEYHHLDESYIFYNAETDDVISWARKEVENE